LSFLREITGNFWCGAASNADLRATDTLFTLRMKIVYTGSVGSDMWSSAHFGIGLTRASFFRRQNLRSFDESPVLVLDYDR
jgi:hypothetical protein